MLENLVWLVPLGVAVAGIWRPRAGLLVLAATLPLFGSPPGGPYLAALDVAGIAAILTAWRGGRPRPSLLAWPVAAFVAISLVTLIPSPYQPPSWQPSTLLGLVWALPGVGTWSALYTWRAAADLVLGWGLFEAVRRAFGGRSARPLALALASGLAVAVLLGLASQSSLLDLGGFRPQYDYQEPVPRMYSLFFLSGWFAEYIVLATPVAIAGLHAGGRLGRRLILPLAAVALAALGLAQQRGAWLAALVQLVFWAAVAATRWRERDRGMFKAVAAGAVTLVLTAAVFVGTGTPVRPVLERARSIESGLAPRVPLWAAAAGMALERPLLGWGLGSFAPAYDLAHPRGSPGASRYRNTAHSLYLDIAAERGVLGLLALGLLVGSAAACLRRPSSGSEGLALGLAASLVGAVTYGLVQYLFHLRNIAWILWLLMGCVALVGRRENVAWMRRAAQGLMTLALLMVAVRVVAVGQPPYAGNHEFGFHEMENDTSGPFWWTEGVAARRLPWVGETLVLPLANGHARGAERPVEVIVGVDGKTVAQLTVAGAWQEYRIALGPPRKEWISLSLRARPTFRPFSDYRRYADLSPSLDIRSLGVAMRPPRWESAASAAAGAPPGLVGEVPAERRP